VGNGPPAFPEERRYSRIFEGHPELIDHVLVSRALLGHAARADTSTTDLPFRQHHPDRPPSARSWP
jgi:hypothetical protein